MRQLIVVLLSLAVALSSCAGGSHSSHEEHSHAHHHEVSDKHRHEVSDKHHHEVSDKHRHEAASHGSEIIISPQDALRAGIQSTEIKTVPFQQAIRCSGELVSGTKSQTVISAASSGILCWSGFTPSVGQSINKGQTLASITAAASIRQNSSAQIAYETARKQYERAAKLLQDRIISEKEYLEIERNYLDAQINYKGIEIIAPQSGSITRIFAQDGSYLEKGANIVSLSTLKTLRLEVQLSEQYYSQIGSITDANFTLPYLGNTLNLSELSGKLISSSKQIQSGYVSIIFEFPNSQQLLPGSYAQVWLLCGRKDAIALDESALIEEQGEFFVYLQLDEECYRKQPVKTGGRNGRQVEILQGLKTGDKVVSQGAYQVKLASGTIIPGHSHNH